MHAVLVPHRAQVEVALFGVFLRVGQAVGFHQGVRHIHAETVDPEVEPVPQDVVETLLDQVGVPVEVGLVDVEQVEVPLFRGAVGALQPRPSLTAEQRPPVVWRQLTAGAPAVADQVALPLRGAGFGRDRGLEPFVGIRGVVRYQVDDHPQAQRVGLLDQSVGVGSGTEQRIDLTVVGDVVASVGHGGAVERAQPHRVHAQFLEVGQFRDHARQVPVAVTVAVGEGAGIYLVDGGGSPPFVVVCHVLGPVD